LRTQFVESQEELDATKKRATELQSKVSDNDRELIAAKAKLSAAEKGGIEAFDELKSTDKLISESLKAELDRLREDYSFAISERDAQKSQLIEALLAKDKLRKEIEDSKELQEGSMTGPVDADISEAMKKSSEKIEKLRARLKERKLVSCQFFSLSMPLVVPFRMLLLSYEHLPSRPQAAHASDVAVEHLETYSALQVETPKMKEKESTRLQQYPSCLPKIGIDTEPFLGGSPLYLVFQIFSD
jgi:protein HOOK3